MLGVLCHEHRLTCFSYPKPSVVGGHVKAGNTSYVLHHFESLEGMRQVDNDIHGYDYNRDGAQAHAERNSHEDEHDGRRHDHGLERDLPCKARKKGSVHCGHGAFPEDFLALKFIAGPVVSNNYHMIHNYGRRHKRGYTLTGLVAGRNYSRVQFHTAVSV
ncbi:hypothetical protein ONE63_009910 [Megalurothrips usitatus]|uniref:Uncharacterized protein n=1 Tax=Megalurothrips usitatus TaxID=439358 RepID=A0AAV7XJ05_9NEOP|nr:hypothetical protein ONE63_009910 [Megalurothrips usitatus]